MRTLIFAIALTLAGASTASAAETVAENASISSAVEESFSPKLAELILSTPYDAFYKVNGKMKRRGEYRFNNVKDNESFPDDRWEDVALDVIKRVNFVSEANQLGSRTKPSATAYVVMYKGGIEGIKHTGEGESLALVMINQQNAANPEMPTIKQSGTSLYLMDLSLN